MRTTETGCADGGDAGARRCAERRLFGLVVGALDGYIPSIVAIGCARAWLSMQTGLIDAYETQVVLDSAFGWVQNAALVCASLLFALIPLGAGFERRRAPIMIACGLLGAALYAGALYAPWGPGATAVAAGLLIACLCWFIRVWCEDNCSGDLRTVLTRLGASFVVQYIVYSVVLLIPPAIQGVCAWGTPLLMAACLRKRPAAHLAYPAYAAYAACPAGQSRRSGREGNAGAHGGASRLGIPGVAILAAVVTLCCAAHGLLFNFSSTVSGVWVLGSFMVGVLSLSVVACGGDGPILKKLVCATVAVQCVSAVLSLLFPGNLDWISLAKSISYTASMMLAFSIGCLVGSTGRGEKARGRIAAAWVALFFLAVCAAFYGGKAFLGDSSLLLIAVLVLLVASAVLMLGRDGDFDRETSAETLYADADANASDEAAGICGAGGAPGAEPGERGLSFEQMAARSGLTPQEESVLGHLLAGRSVREAAELNGVSVNTVRSQVQAVYRKLGVHSREELLACAAQEDAK